MVLFNGVAAPRGKKSDPDPQIGPRDDSARFPHVDLAGPGGGDARGTEFVEAARVLTRKSGELLRRRWIMGGRQRPYAISFAMEIRGAPRPRPPVGARIARERVREGADPTEPTWLALSRIDQRTSSKKRY